MSPRVARALWTAAAALPWAGATYAAAYRFAPDRTVPSGTCAVGLLIALIVTRAARRRPTRTRQPWDLGWGLHVGRALLVLAGLLPLSLGVAGVAGAGLTMFRITAVAGAAMGMVFGVVLGWGGVLGVAEAQAKSLAAEPPLV